MSSRSQKFLDLVNVKQNNFSPTQTKRRFSLCETFIKERDAVANNKPKVPQEKEYLKLSSQIKFDPDASPSSSILSKRKVLGNTPGSSPLTSSSAKRKRVGFRDPVSSTKEYLISEEEARQKSKSLIRCLRYENEAETDADDEDVEINKENIIKTIDIKDEIKSEAKSEETQKKTLVPHEAIRDHDYGDQNSSQHAAISTSNTSITPVIENELRFKNQNELLDYVSKNLSVDELLKKLTQAEEESFKRKELISKVIQSVGINGVISEYFKISDATNSQLTSEQNVLITSIVTEISKLMQTNMNVKHKVFEVLSEDHSKALLDHALLENSPNEVCNKIAFSNIINFMIHKTNVNSSQENYEQMKMMNNELIRVLINNTQNDKAIFPDNKEICDLMELLFKNKDLSEIIDVSNVVLRKLVKKR